MTAATSPARWRRRAPALAAAALLLLGGAAMVRVSRSSSPAWDEVNAFGLGGWYVETGRFDLPGAYHPPLAAYLGSLLIDRAGAVASGAFAPLPPGAPAAALLENDVARGNALLHRLGLEALLAARLPFIGAWLLLGALVFLWSSRWFGPAGGLLSLALYLADPSLAAHGYLLGTDLLPAALGFAALHFLFRALEAPGPWSLGGFLLCLALAPTAKLLGLLAAPAAALAILWRAFTAPRLAVWLPGRGRREVGRATFLATWAGVGLLGVAAGYLALVGAYQGQWDLADFRRCLEAARTQVGRGFQVLLLGEVRREGFAAFYLLAIPLKTSAAGLAAWLLAGLVPGPRRAAGWAPVVLSALLVLVLLTLSRFTVGLRYGLLALPLLHVAAGRLAAGRTADGTEPAPAPWPRLALCAALAALALAGQVDVHPYPRAYVNTLVARGPAWRALADSDLDWGEGLIALRDFIAARRPVSVALSYHGAAEPRLFGVRPDWYENPLTGAVEAGPPPARGWLFVSATNRSGLFFGEERHRWLGDAPPDAVVGGSILAYDLGRLAAGGTAPPR